MEVISGLRTGPLLAPIRFSAETKITGFFNNINDFLNIYSITWIGVLLIFVTKKKTPKKRKKNIHRLCSNLAISPNRLSGIFINLFLKSKCGIVGSINSAA